MSDFLLIGVLGVWVYQIVLNIVLENIVNIGMVGYIWWIIMFGEVMLVGGGFNVCILIVNNGVIVIGFVCFVDVYCSFVVCNVGIDLVWIEIGVIWFDWIEILFSNNKFGDCFISFFFVVQMFFVDLILVFVCLVMLEVVSIVVFVFIVIGQVIDIVVIDFNVVVKQVIDMFNFYGIVFVKVNDGFV